MRAVEGKGGAPAPDAPPALPPLETLYDANEGSEMPLPPALAALYGPLRFPTRPAAPYVMSNFVTTLDGVVSLNMPGRAGGGDISGRNRHDRAVMGLLRAVADAVIVGAGTARPTPNHLWTAEYIFPPLAEAYQELRAAMGKQGPPLNVIVTAGGDLDLGRRVFTSGEVPALILTTARGAARLRRQPVPRSTEIVEAQAEGRISARRIVEAAAHASQGDFILMEAGPHLMADFLAERCLDEQFLTLAPQVAGRDGSSDRPGLVAGRLFAPEQPLWGALTAVKRGGSHLFLRYAFPIAGSAGSPAEARSAPSARA